MPLGESWMPAPTSVETRRLLQHHVLDATAPQRESGGDAADAGADDDHAGHDARQCKSSVNVTRIA